MIEFSTTEFCLLCWAILATAKAMEYRFDARNYHKVIVHMLGDTDAYTRASGDFKKQLREWELNNNQSSREG
jgi:hypothetical protein